MALEAERWQMPNRELFAEALDALPEVFSQDDLSRWFAATAPWVDPLWVEGRLVGDTVNDRGRQHIPSPMDLLFLRADGRFERYNPAVHGRWSRVGAPVLSLAVGPEGRPGRRRLGFLRRRRIAAA